MYKLMRIISFLIRQYYIPNPFEALGNELIVDIWDASLLLTPTMLNWIAGLFLPGLTYVIVGMYYEERSNPRLGCLLYLVFFAIHNFVLQLMSNNGFSNWSVGLILIAYVILHIILLTIKNRSF